MSGEVKPLVSIRCAVYNHEPFLRQCLDGFVMQRTNFPFEAIVHDDCSTDGSAAIIREYAEKYPDIIKPVYETENKYSKHDGSLWRAIDAAMHPESKYVAVCEGDDYWTDPDKLQIQVDFLESHPDFVLTSHDYIPYYEDLHRFAEHTCWGQPIDADVSRDKYIEYSRKNYFDDFWTRPLTCLYRRGPYWAEVERKGYAEARDDVYYYYVLQQAKGALLMRPMGVYRIHSGGVWAGISKVEQYKKSADTALKIYAIEGDLGALKKARVSTIGLIGTLSQEGKIKRVFSEIANYYRHVPFKAFVQLPAYIAYAIIDIHFPRLNEWLKKALRKA